MPYFRQRGSTWSFTVDVPGGKDPINSKRLQKTLAGFPSEPAARIACDKLLMDLEQGRRVDHVTLGDFITYYLETEVKHQIEESSYNNQYQSARDYIVLKLGKNRIDRLTHAHIVKILRCAAQRW